MAIQDAEAGGRGDRVRAPTRAVAYAIVPFLVVAFAVLWPVPGDTGALFAWPIAPSLTAMVLGSAYLGGAYFFTNLPELRSNSSNAALFALSAENLANFGEAEVAT